MPSRGRAPQPNSWSASAKALALFAGVRYSWQACLEWMSTSLPARQTKTSKTPVLPEMAVPMTLQPG